MPNGQPATTFGDRYAGLSLNHRILYAKKRPLVIEQAYLDPDNLPGVEYDPNGNPVAGTDSEAGLEAWLDQVVTDERLDGWGDGRNSEYGIALGLLDAVPESARGTLYRLSLSWSLVHQGGCHSCETC